MSMHLTMDHFVRGLERALAGDYRGTDKEYPYIAYDNEEFVKLLLTAYGVWLGRRARVRTPTRMPHFIDVGCGIGSKVMLAQSVLHMQAFGLEKHHDYCEAARKMLGEPNRVIEADGIAYKGYSKFDIVYFYCPLHDKDAETQLENAIIQQLKPNAVIISPMYATLDSQKCLTRVARNVYVKRTRRYANAVRRTTNKEARCR